MNGGKVDRIRRACSTATVLVLSVLVMPLPADPAVAAPGRGLANLASCVRQSPRLNVLFMLDASGSVARTDAAGRRFAATRVALTQLGLPVPAIPGRRAIEVDVHLATFATTVTDVVGWHRLDGSTAQVDRDVRALTAQRLGGDTDYGAALSGARQRMAEQAARSFANARPCQLLVWLTDGQYEPVDRSDRNFPARRDAGLREMCEPGGILDQLRGDGITLVVVGLATELSPADEGLLQRLTGLGSPACGQPTPDRAGQYLRAADQSELVRLFYGIVVLPSEPPHRCQPGPAGCTFRLEPGLRTFSILIEPNVAGPAIGLRAPDGGEMVLSRRDSAEAVTFAGARLAWHWIDTGSQPVVIVRGTLDPSAAREWAGQWAVRFADTAPGGVAHVYLYGDQEPVLPGDLRFVRGRPWVFAVSTRTVDGAPPVVLPDAPPPQLEVSVEQPGEPRVAMPVSRAADGKWAVRFEAPAQWRAATVTVRVRLTMRTRGGIDISPPEMAVPVSVVSTIAVQPAQLDFGTVKGSGSGTGTLRLRAESERRCVWVRAGAELSATVGNVNPVQVSVDGDGRSRDNCLVIPAGEERSLRLTGTFTSRGRVASRATGQVVLLVAGAGGVEDEVVVPGEMRLAPGTPPSSVPVLMVALALLSALPPVLLFMLINRVFLARLRREPVLTARYELSVAPDVSGTRLRHFDGRPWRPGPEDFETRTPGSYRLCIGGITLRPRVPLGKPFGMPSIAVRAWRRRFDDRGLPTTGEVSAARGLELADRVVVSVPKAREPQTVEVAVVLSSRRRITADTVARIRESASVGIQRLLPVQRTGPDR